GNATPPAMAPFSAGDPDTYNHTTSVTVFDSLGAPHSQSMYFVRTANPNEWQVHTQIDGIDVGGPQTLQYSDAGTLLAPAGGNIPLPAHTPPGGAAPMNISLDLEQIGRASCRERVVVCVVGWLWKQKKRTSTVRLKDLV